MRIKPILVTVAALASLALAGPLGAAEKAPKNPVDRLAYPKLHDIKPPAVVRETLPNGMKLLLIEDHDLPEVVLRTLVRGGVDAEPKGERGLAALFGVAYRSGGTSAMSGDQVDELLDRLGAEIETSVAEEYGVVSGKTLAENLDRMLPVYADFLMSPAFAQDKVDLAKTHLRGVIARRNDQVFGIAGREMRRLIYGADSPFARQYDYDDIDALTRADLLAFHHTYYRPDGTILTAAGDFKADEMKARLGKAFAGWKASGPPPTIARPTTAPTAGSINYIEKKDLEQTFIIMAHLGMRLDDPDYPAVNLMSEILGGGFASRIFVNVRTKKGLAYNASGWTSPGMDHPGVVGFLTSTKPETTAEALAATLEEIRKIREAPVTDAELKRAKDGYLNGYAFEYDSTAKIVDRLAGYEFYGYPQDFNVKLRDAIERVTKEDILRVAQKDLHPESLAIIAIGRADQFDKPLSTFGKVNTIDIAIPEPKPREAAAEATPESLARGRALLVAAARAAGESALTGLKDITSEGVTTANTPMGAMELKGKATFVLPDRVHNEMVTPMGAMVQVLDRDAAWMTMGEHQRSLPPSAVEEMRSSLFTEAGCALLLREALTGRVTAQALGKSTFEGRDAEDVLVRLGDKPVHVYLSPDAGEVLGVRRTAQTPEGPAEMVESFGAYQTVAGLRVPFESTEKVKDEVKAAIKTTSVKLNAGYSEDLFKRPAPTAAK